MQQPSLREQHDTARAVEGRWLWVVIPSFGALWAAINLRHSYFFYDEWSMLDRVLHTDGGPGMVASFNGHLYVLQYWLYRAQVVWFGINDHTFVSVVFVCSLVALHVSLAALLRASGQPTLSSLLIGGLLTYLGGASQNFIFAFQNPQALSFAANAAAAAIALDRRPSVARYTVAALLMLVSVGIDSGVAVIGMPLAFTVVLLRWRPMGALVIGPSVLALAWWHAARPYASPYAPATIGEGVAFAGHLLLRALGGLIGRGEIVGAFLLLLSIGVFTVGLRRRWITGKSCVMLIAGSVSTVASIAALTLSRASLPGFNFVDFNRYIQNVAMPATLALVPAWTATARAALVRQPGLKRIGPSAGIALVLVAFLLGLGPMRSYVRTFAAWNDATRRGVQSAAVVVRNGCPSGAEPSPSSRPLGDLDPQITTQLVRDLIHRGAARALSDLARSGSCAADVLAIETRGRQRRGCLGGVAIVATLGKASETWLRPARRFSPGRVADARSSAGSVGVAVDTHVDQRARTARFSPSRDGCGYPDGDHASHGPSAVARCASFIQRLLAAGALAAQLFSIEQRSYPALRPPGFQHAQRKVREGISYPSHSRNDQKCRSGKYFNEPSSFRVLRIAT